LEKQKYLFNIFASFILKHKSLMNYSYFLAKKKIHTESKNKMIMELDKVSITGFNLTEKSIYVYKNHLVF